MTGNSIQEKMWNYLIGKGLTEAGAAGLMGNLKAESGLKPDNLEDLCERRLKENGKNYTDATYTAAVDAGTIGRKEFLNPLSNRQYGYGLAQWTSPSRKAGLYDLVKSRGVSIADLEAQLDWLMTEMTVSYKKVLNVLKTAKTVQEASDYVLCNFEQPDDCGASVRACRVGMGQAYYDQYTRKEKTMEAIDRVIKIAEGEKGYLEKASNSQLDSKTANAGSGNFTKYWRDVYPQFQGQAWCAAFISWCFMQAFGIAMAKKLLKHWPYTYCPTIGNLFTRYADPEVGDIVIFYHSGQFTHTGLVIAVNGDLFTTIEGNTSGASGIIANGGGVCRKTYYNSQLPGTKFCRPDYSLVNAETEQKETGGSCSVELKTFVKGNTNNQIKAIQRILKSLGYKGKDGKKLMVDGNLGDNTAYALEQFQRKNGMDNINFGTVAARTWSLLLNAK